MKEIIKWDDKYLTNIEIIDSQHKKIFKSVNEIFDALEELEKKEKILELVNHLDFYTNVHFNTEENYMLDLGYPEYNEHKKAHDAFKKTYELIKNNYIYKQGKSVYVLAIHLNQTLADWLDHHLQNEDQRLAIFLRTLI